MEVCGYGIERIGDIYDNIFANDAMVHNPYYKPYFLSGIQEQDQGSIDYRCCIGAIGIEDRYNFLSHHPAIYDENKLLSYYQKTIDDLIQKSRNDISFLVFGGSYSNPKSVENAELLAKKIKKYSSETVWLIPPDKLDTLEDDPYDQMLKKVLIHQKSQKIHFFEGTDSDRAKRPRKLAHKRIYEIT